MSIPRIDPYPMPGAADIPPTTASGAVDPARAALLIHDMQESALRPFPPGRPPVTELVRNATRLRRRCAELGIPVSYTARPDAGSEPAPGSWADFWGPDATGPPEFIDIAGPLAPAPQDRVFTTWRYSAFHATDLAEFLADEGRDQLILCGVYAHVGVLVTVCDAFTKDLQVFLVADAVADLSPEHHRLALAMAAQRCAVTPTTDTVLEWLGAPGDPRRPAPAAASAAASAAVPAGSRARLGRQPGRRQAILPV